MPLTQCFTEGHLACCRKTEGVWRGLYTSQYIIARLIFTVISTQIIIILRTFSSTLQHLSGSPEC